MSGELVVVRGGGDLGSGVALRLWRCGFRLLVLESSRPVAVRRTVAFAEAVYDGHAQVEEAEACLMSSSDVNANSLPCDHIGVVVDPGARVLLGMRPAAVIDAIMAKRNTGTGVDMAPTVIGLGPGFEAGVDVHAVVETNRGPNLGRVIWRGGAEGNTGRPGMVAGHDQDRVLRSPVDGKLHSRHHIGDIVEAGDAVAEVEGQVVRAPFRSLLRGLARDGLEVRGGMKIGDVDPRLDPSLCRLVSDKSLAIAGGVLEAILSARRNGNA